MKSAILNRKQLFAIIQSLPAAKFVSAGLWLTCFWLAAPAATKAATIWNGPPITESDATEPDQITANVWLTRGGSQGLYNAVTETGFTHFLSPADTEWADGTTSNYNSLSYTDWNTWAKNIHGGPPNTVGVNAVVHLISDDIYIDITFTSWSSGGSYSYRRSTPAVANNPPSVTLTSPTNGMVFAAPANITVQASASDSDGTVTNVQFLVDTTILTNTASPPFFATTDNLTAGNYTLFAIATDNLGANATNAVNISVVTPVQIDLGAARQLSATSFQFSYAANAGLNYVIQRSTNLLSTNWVALITNLAASSPVIFVDSNAPASSALYRVGRLPNP